MNFTAKIKYDNSKVVKECSKVEIEPWRFPTRLINEGTGMLPSLHVFDHLSNRLVCSLHSSTRDELDNSLWKIAINSCHYTTDMSCEEKIYDKDGDGSDTGSFLTRRHHIATV